MKEKAKVNDTGKREVFSTEKALRITLKSAGFLTGSGELVDGLIDSDKAKKDYRIALRHKLLNENQEVTKIDLVYETPATIGEKGRSGHTCIYFKKIDENQDIKKIRESVWNTGAAPLLWLISPTKVHIYNAFAKPKKEDTEKTHRLKILDILDITSQGLKALEEFKRELFDTGKFWESKIGEKLNPNQRVERSLLDDLWDTENVLTRKNGGLPVHIAHAILGRCIFMKYLEDRKIIAPEELNKNFGHRNIKGLLKDKKQLYNFFRWLRETFNGDLFPIGADEETAIKDEEDTNLEIIRLFFEGAVMSSIQFDKHGKIRGYDTRLWPYNFKIIPIELISSIYEMFAHSIDPDDARAKSIHYTKLHLVELVQSLAMQDLSDNARILDPACGSGVFLVDAFRRIVWKKKIESDMDLDREEIREILLNQIYGVDVEPGAVEVTAFSLYLALLELSEVVESRNDFKFPKLIYDHKKKWEEDYPPTLYKQDIGNTEHVFNENEPFKSAKFDLIVGNPPWTKLENNTAPRDPENPTSGKQWLLDYCKEMKIYLNHPDQAIMIRVRDFARPDTKIAFIISSSIFYQQEKTFGNFWLNSFLKENSVELVINLTDLCDSQILFGGKKGAGKSTIMPASIIIYKPQIPEPDSCITYICPKWYPRIKRRENIVIRPPDIQTISNNLLIENPHLWNVAFRGTQRDFELIQKFYKKFALKNILDQINVPNAHRGKGYDYGLNYKEDDFPEYFSLPNLEVDKDFKYFINPESLPPFSYEELGAKKNIGLFKGPLLVFRRSLKEKETRVAFVPEDTIFSNAFFGISFHDKDERIAHRINAVLNTKFGLYFVFLLGDSLSWHFKTTETKDWLRFPLPPSILDLDDNRWDEAIAIENELCESWASLEPTSIKILEDSLFKLVCDLYELNEQERIIVEDTIKYTIDLYLNRNARSREKRDNIRRIAFKSPKLDKLQKYANRLCKQLNSMLALDGKKLIHQLYEVGKESPLTVVEFKQTSMTTTQVNEPKEVEGIENALSDLSQNMKNEIVGNIYALAHLRVYEGEHLYIIKPSEERFWSESAALNDADEIIRDHMGGENETS